MNIKLSGLTKEEIDNLFTSNLIFLSYRGSIAHNMYIPQGNEFGIDDKDIIAIYFTPYEFYMGLGPSKRIVDKYNFYPLDSTVCSDLCSYEYFYNEYDILGYEFKKFFKLLLKLNPNVLGLLWIEDRNIILNTPYMAKLRDNRDLFLTKEVYHTFKGYAHGQFEKMTSYTKEGYMGKKRKELVDKYGYDCKMASHLIRLLKMCIEFLTEGRFIVERKDSQELLAYKTGKYTLQEVKERASKLFELCEEAYVRSDLSKELNVDAIENLYMEIFNDYCNNHLDKRGNKFTKGVINYG